MHCIECDQPTERPKFCSNKCQTKNWRQLNREHYNAMLRAWREKNPGRKPRRPKPTLLCKNCGKPFVRQSGPNRFCSVRCRSKLHRAKPEQKEKHYWRQKRWRTENAERNRAYHRTYQSTYKLKKITAVPWISLLQASKQRSTKLGLAFDLDRNWFASRWTGRCELTNLEFNGPEKRKGYKSRNLSPSIDKIDPNKGYTKDNCRIILWAINSLKRDGTDDEMYLVAEALIKNRPA